MKILMVCLGNICRSPMAEGILRELARQEEMDITVDSAGTSDYHVNEAPDRRAQSAMRKHGIDIGELRGRQLASSDFRKFDLLLAMDESNFRNMLDMAPDANAARKVRLIMDYAPTHTLREVPDPYYGGDQGFDDVHAMLTEASRNLLNDVRSAQR